MGSRMRNVVVMLLAFTLGVGGPALAEQVEKESSASSTGSMQGSRMMDSGKMGMMHRGMDRGGHHGMMGHRYASERPIISLMLQNKEALKLAPEQVQKLETLRLNFRKAAIKRSADLQVAELELDQLRRQQSVDLAKVEAQVKRIETLRAEQRLSRIRTIEEGKALLTAEQRERLKTLGQAGVGGHAKGMMACPMMMGSKGGTMGPSGGGENK
ncbi:MAG: periplasmic heavy metal sensor [Acidobacteriota bacterium]